MPIFVITLISMAAMAAASFITPAHGAGESKGERVQFKVEPELIPGAYLMKPAEREQYRQRIQSAGSAEEKARIRAEHTQAMEQRARSVGLALSKEPATRRSGDAVKGAALHNVCFSCHGPERYTAAKERAASFLASSVTIASGIDDAFSIEASSRRPESLPVGAPRMSRSQVRDVAGLKRAVTRWNDFLNPKLTETEVDDLVAYLNAAYYRF